MATYNDNIAYDLDRFSSAAPKKKAAPQPPRPKLVKKPQRLIDRQAQLKANRRKIIKFIAVASVCLSFVGTNIYLRVQINELNNAIVSLDSELSEKQAENTRLNMALNSKISVANVKEYAEEVLGMVKRDRYQIVYFDIDNGNQIVAAE